MIESRQEIARERRRQMQVRQAFDAGLALNENQRTQLTSFYAACGEYLVYSMDRLHEQDQVIHDLLVERIPANDNEAHRRLADLNVRQDASRVVVETFRQASGLLKTAGAEGTRAFEQAAKIFADAFNRMMTPRKNPFSSYTDRLFDDADWERIADVSAEFHTTENKLFLQVAAEAPEGIDPAQYKVGHRPVE